MSSYMLITPPSFIEIGDGHFFEWVSGYVNFLPQYFSKTDTMRKIQTNVLTLILDAQKAFFYPEKPQVVVITFYFMVKVRNTLFLGRNRIQKKSDA